MQQLVLESVLPPQTRNFDSLPPTPSNVYINHLNNLRTNLIYLLKFYLFP